MAEETMMEAASALTLLGLATPKRSRAASEDSPSSKRPKLLVAPSLVALQQILTQSELENDSPKAVGQRKLPASSKSSVNNSRSTTGLGSSELRRKNAKLAALEVAANTIREALGGSSPRRPHTDEYEQGKIDLLAKGLQANNKRSIATPAPSGTHLSVVSAVSLPGHGVEVKVGTSRPAKRPSLKVTESVCQLMSFEPELTITRELSLINRSRSGK